MEKFWLKNYPPGVNHTVDVEQYRSLPHFFEEAFSRYATREFSTNFGVTHTYGQIDELARQVGAWLQAQGLAPGATVAIMMPNVQQYVPIMMGAVRAGYVITSVNPMYTPRELKHQLNDAGAEAIFILENFCSTLEKVIEETSLKRVVITRIGDLLGAKGLVANMMLKHVKKMVPKYSLVTGPRYRVLNFPTALKEGKGRTLTPPQVGLDDLALLQYTGGTTGVAKGVLITHRNVLSGMLQASEWFGPVVRRLPQGEVANYLIILPLYHLFAFLGVMFSMRNGFHVTLITNPRDIPGLIKTLGERPFHFFPGVNTLFHALMNHPKFAELDFSSLVMTLTGGMAAVPATAQKWQEMTGCPMIEGWGMTETMGASVCNPVIATEFSGKVGIPLPSVEISIRDDEGREVALGEVGELCVSGASVCRGYHRLDNAQYFTKDGYLKTGDVASMDEEGFIKLYDRKKDMLIVSGFNVFPTEIEAVLLAHPKVAECGVIGVEDDKRGQAVKAIVMKADPSLTEEELRAHCQENLTGYKRPRHYEFADEIPKTAVGKIMRHELRQNEEAGGAAGNSASA